MNGRPMDGRPTGSPLHLEFDPIHWNRSFGNSNPTQPGGPMWQRNYYEHIIRDEGELNRVREYIQNNPLNWETDKENPERS